MSKSILLDKSKEFAVETVKLCRRVAREKHEFNMTDQLIRSATSVGANVHESKYAQSAADFVNKLKVALKECYESEYWLEVLVKTDIISDEEYRSGTAMCSALRRMLISSVNTTEKHQTDKKSTLR